MKRVNRGESVIKKMQCENILTINLKCRDIFFVNSGLWGQDVICLSLLPTYLQCDNCLSSSTILGNYFPIEKLIKRTKMLKRQRQWTGSRWRDLGP